MQISDKVETKIQELKNNEKYEKCKIAQSTYKNPIKYNDFILKNIENRVLQSKHNKECNKVQAWIKALFTVYPSLPNIISVIDNIVMQRASSVVPYSQVYNGSVSTVREIEKVIDMSERKNKILNIVALIREVLSTLSTNDYEIVEMKFFRRMKTSSISSKLNIDERSVFRRIKKALERSTSVCLSSGYDSLFIEKMVKGE